MNPPCVHNVRCIYFLTPKATEADSSSCSANIEKQKKKQSKHYVLNTKWSNGPSCLWFLTVTGDNHL